MSYIHPHARRASKTATEETSARDVRSSERSSLSRLTPSQFRIEEIQKHYWPDFNLLEDGIMHKTLHASVKHPKTLQFVLLFPGANPNWSDMKTIYVKSNLELLGLPSTESTLQHGMAVTGMVTDKTKTKDSQVLISSAAVTVSNASVAASNSSLVKTDRDYKLDESRQPIELPKQPIAVFESHYAMPPRQFKFSGYHRIVNIDHIPPESPELVKMLEQKWSRSMPTNSLAGSSETNFEANLQSRRRRAEDWERSLRLPWAVVQFEEMPAEALKEMGLSKPNIAMLDLPLRSNAGFRNTGGRGRGNRPGHGWMRGTGIGGERGRGRADNFGQRGAHTRGRGARVEHRGLSDMLSHMDIRGPNERHSQSQTNNQADEDAETHSNGWVLLGSQREG